MIAGRLALVPVRCACFPGGGLGLDGLATQYFSWILARSPADPLHALSEFSERFRYLVQSLRERYGLLPVMVPIAAPAVCWLATTCATVLVFDMATGRKAADGQPRWARWAADLMGRASDAVAPNSTGPTALAALKTLLVACPVVACGAYFVLGPHPHDTKLQTMTVAGGLSVAFWAVLVKPKGTGWRIFLFGLHASAAGIADEIFWSYLSWWLSQLPDDPIQAAGGFPWLLSEHIDRLQAQFGGLAGMSPFASAAFVALGSWPGRSWPRAS